MPLSVYLITWIFHDWSSLWHTSNTAPILSFCLSCFMSLVMILLLEVGEFSRVYTHLHIGWELSWLVLRATVVAFLMAWVLFCLTVLLVFSCTSPRKTPWFPVWLFMWLSVIFEPLLFVPMPEPSHLSPLWCSLLLWTPWLFDGIVFELCC